MKINKVNNYNFNIKKRDFVSKEKEKTVSSNNFVSLPNNPKLWQALSFKGNFIDPSSDCFYETCCEEDGVLNKNKLQLIRDIQENIPQWAKYTIGFAKLRKIAPEDASSENYEFLKEKMLRLKDAKCADLGSFINCFNICKTKDGGFDNELYEKAAVLMDYQEYYITLEEIVLAIKNAKNIENLSFKEKVECLAKINLLSDDLILQFNLSNTIAELENSIADIKLNPVDKKDEAAFFDSFFKIPQDNSLSAFEITIKDSFDTLKNYKDGLALKYSRSEFLSDLEELDLDKETFSKLAIEPIYKNGKLSGYDGLIMLDKIDKESYLYEICHKFLYENAVQTGDDELDSELNKIIKAIPEFINIIGKTQHDTHDYSLDIHSLLVLADSINNPDYKTLNASDRAVLKTVCLFHDLTKKEGVVDKGHQNSSSVFVKAIVSRFFNNHEAVDRVCELTKNHHWFEEFIEADNEKTFKKIAFNFRRKNDFELAKIFTRADLKGVSDEFYSKYKDALKNLDNIEKYIQAYYESGNAIFSDYPKINCLKEENYNGFNYKVLNFNKIKPDEDLAPFGFIKGKTRRNVRFLVHTVNEKNIKKNLDMLKTLTSSASEAALSESLISPDEAKTYDDRKFGVILDELNTNLINIENSDSGSGYKKYYDDIIYGIFSDNSIRHGFRNSLLELLQIDCSNEEYAEFYKKNIAGKTQLNQIKDNETFILSNKTFSGKELKQAITEFQDSLLSTKKHNEIVGCTPKIKGVIAKAQALSELPNELLEFARENNLPVVLI